MSQDSINTAIVASKNVKGTNARTTQRKVYTSTIHTMPIKKTPRAPKNLHKALLTRPSLDTHSIIKAPLTTEAALKCIEKHNTIVFLVHLKAHKPQIKKAFSELYNVKVMKVNTLIRPDGQKKAFIRLAGETDALDIASKIGVL